MQGESQPPQPADGCMIAGVHIIGQDGKSVGHGRQLCSAMAQKQSAVVFDSIRGQKPGNGPSCERLRGGGSEHGDRGIVHQGRPGHWGKLQGYG